MVHPLRSLWPLAMSCLLLSGGCTVRSTTDRESSPASESSQRPGESSESVEADGSTGAGGSPGTGSAAGGGQGCGNYICEMGESCSSCSGDCGECAPGCGDGSCAEDESCWDCPDDCGDCCGDGACSGGPESPETCPQDCGPPESGAGCGNGVCEANEDECTCAADCPSDPNSCSACECGGNGGNCYCDAGCIQYGDCCADACQACGQCGSSSSSGGGSGPYTWQTTCGDPVCGGHVWKAEVPACNGILPGEPCSQSGAVCDPVNACNSYLMCSATDPKMYGCPKSLARFKRDIRYLDDGEVAELSAQLVQMRLARWQYKEEVPGSRAHLGFIIDDAPSSPAVAADGEHVDLYGYASMAAAALQVQDKRIRALEEELASLRREMRTGKRRVR